MGRARVILLAPFGVSAVFEAFDHDIVVNRLLVSLGISNKPIRWLRSFRKESMSSTVFGPL